MPDPLVLVQIRRTLRMLVIATVVLFLAVSGVAVYAFFEARGNSDALCALRTDLERRVDSSKNFLRQHPHGISGITAEEIQTGIDNQQRTIDALSDLSCD